MEKLQLFKKGICKNCCISIKKGR